MAEANPFEYAPRLDIAQILLEARSRWLRPSEVCEILHNYQKFHLTSDPPYKPPAGSLFLFDRKVLRYFRRDGYQWKKKKDGKTVREAHEKLKCGSVDVIHCYYARGEDNEKFQRRCYWLLDGQLEHIVLVHYREVNEGSLPCIPYLSTTDTVLQHQQGTQFSIGSQTSYASSPSTVDRRGDTPAAELEDVDSEEHVGAPSPSGSGFFVNSSSASTTSCVDMLGTGVSIPCLKLITGSQRNQAVSQNIVPVEGCHLEHSEAIQAPGIMELPIDQLRTRPFSRIAFPFYNFVMPWPHAQCKNQRIADAKKVSFSQQSHIDSLNRTPNASTMSKYAACGFLTNALIRKDDNLAKDHCKEDGMIHQSDRSGEVLPADYPPLCETEDSFNAYFVRKTCMQDGEPEGLKRLDSFDRWMNKEIGKDCDDFVMASDSGSCWDTLNTGTHDDNEVSSLSHHMQLDTDSLSPSISKEQLFSILDYSPDWAYSGSEAKILISGTFLSGMKYDSVKWCCMFGEVEVQAEVLAPNVLRCKAPVHAPGRVPFYITCSNRLACSEVREFEFLENQSRCGLVPAPRNEPKDVIHLQIRLARMLTLGINSEKLVCNFDNCPKCNIKTLLHQMLNDSASEWNIVETKEIPLGDYGEIRDVLIQKLLKKRLYEWLLCKAHEEVKGPNILDEEGQGVIHMAAALGYEWAMSPIVAAGVNPSHRDARGRTGLHWAAYFGREETVVTLLRLGAAPGAVEDPTSKCPVGKTAADLASLRGHKGIAGFLAEADLASHLSALTVKETVIDSVSANLAAEEAVQVMERKIFSLERIEDEPLSIKSSLAAVRNSAQAAARIQVAFRMHSFRQRNLMENNGHSYELSSEAIFLPSPRKVHKIGHFTDSLHYAALKIQQKYRGWKGRKEFLKIRNRIVKIQAHVRGHQVRKQYKKVVWSVGIVEKLILRWRRKGTGLRGFRAERATVADEPPGKNIDEYDFLRVSRKEKSTGVDKALARVQSMARNPEGRDQYMRLVASSQKSELGCACQPNAGDRSSKQKCEVGEDTID